MSSIPAVLAALTSLSRGIVDTDWLVINGPIGSVTTTKGNLVIVGEDDIVATRQLDSMGDGTTSEQYTVPLTVSVFVPGSDQAVADALALETYEVLERAIREYPGGATLGLSGVGVFKALPLGTFTLKRIADPEARYAALRFSVDIYAQNT